MINLMTDNGHELVERHLESDEEQNLAETMREWCSNGEIQLILTTGGTGLGPRDVVPEATRPRDRLRSARDGGGDALGIVTGDGNGHAVSVRRWRRGIEH